MIIGTLSYMAPEILQGKPADRRSDIWSLGAILHETGDRGSTLLGANTGRGNLGDSASSPVPLPAAIPRAIAHCCPEMSGKGSFKSLPECRRVASGRCKRCASEAVGVQYLTGREEAKSFDAAVPRLRHPM